LPLVCLEHTTSVKWKVSKSAGSDQLMKDVSKQYELLSEGEKDKLTDKVESKIVTAVNGKKG